MSQQPGNGRFPLYPSLPTLNPIPIPNMPLPASIPNYPIPYPNPNPNLTPNPIQSIPFSVPSLVGSDVSHPLPATTSKRQREDSVEALGNEAVAAKRRAVLTQDVIFRVVVPSRQIGKVIGKEGCRIQKIREETKATIKIADAVVRHEERVIIISSKDNESKTTNAENALQQIAGLILKEDDTDAELATKVGAVHVAANTIRLLIAGSQAGGLIGMSGQNIEKLRNAYGATITVLPPNQLPLCASALESDRVVQISGDAPAVLKALEGIGQQLRENPPRQVISISPTYNYNFVRPAQPFVDPNSADYVTFDMLISETLVGGLIGRCGSNISKIRTESGATIKVFGGKGTQKHRQIQFGGSAEQAIATARGGSFCGLVLGVESRYDQIARRPAPLKVALAKQRVDEYIYSQLTQQGSQQLA